MQPGNTRPGSFEPVTGVSLPAKILRIFVFSNFFITICAVVMSSYTAQVFHLSFNLPLLVFTASGTLCSYSFHWLLPSTHNELSPRENWSVRNRALLFVLFFIGAAGSFYSILHLISHYWALFPMIILTFLYSSGKLPRGPFVFFRRYFIGKTIYLALMWSLVTIYLPIAVNNAEWSTAHTLFLISRFFFLFAICILFDLRDRESDTLQGIKSFITILPINRIKYLYFSSIAASIVSGLILLTQGFSSFSIFAMMLPVFLLIFIYRYSTMTRSEIWFYFVLDGLMMLSGILYWLFDIFM